MIKIILNKDSLFFNGNAVESLVVSCMDANCAGIYIPTGGGQLDQTNPEMVKLNLESTGSRLWMGSGYGLQNLNWTCSVMFAVMADSSFFFFDGWLFSFFSNL